MTRPPSAAPLHLNTVREVSDLLRKKPAAVRALALRGAISYYRVGRAILFKPADVEAFLARVRRPARAERGL